MRDAKGAPGTPVGVQGGRVRLGFEADAEVKVWRSEIQKDIDEATRR